MVNDDGLSEDRYTYVLIHGSWHTGDSLHAVAESMRQAGHEVHTPTMVGHGEGSDKSVSHADQVASILHYITENDLHDVVLVGHSFGGTIIAKLAEQLPERIRRLVFWSAFVLENGDSIIDEVPLPFQQLFGQLRASSPDGSIMLPFPIWREAFMNDSTFATAKETYALLGAEPQSSFYTELDLTKFYELINTQQLACSYIHCTGDTALPAGEFNWYPRFPNRLGLCRIIEFPGASHESLFSDPEGLAEHIIHAGRD